MSKIVKLFAILAIVGMAFVGCQKDDGIVNDNKILRTTGKIVPIGLKGQKFKFGPPTITIPHVKSEVKDYYSTYYGDPPITYKTAIIGNQEWMIEDWENKYVDGSENLETGAYRSPYNNKIYYEWSVLENTEQSTIDNYVFADKPGFHIPTTEDIQQLMVVAGNDFSKVLAVLRMNHDTYDWWGHANTFVDVSNDSFYSYFWLYEQDNPSREPGCGVVLISDKTNLDLSRLFTNIKTLGKRVRFVRNLN